VAVLAQRAMDGISRIESILFCGAPRCVFTADNKNWSGDKSHKDAKEAGAVQYL
jgi:hypothetical protein